MSRALFVGDRAQLRSRVQVLLDDAGARVELSYAPTGAAAIAALADERWDVVVADRDLPGARGEEVLTHVRDHHPSTIRVIVAGPADHQHTALGPAVAQVQLTEPIEPGAMRDVVVRSCALANVLAHKELQRVVGKPERLPSAPQVFWDLSRAIADATSTTEDIAVVVERDPALSAKVLQLTNSAYFGLSARVASIHQAVTYVGVEVLKALSLTAHIFCTLDDTPVPGLSIAQFQRSSLLGARLARLFVQDVRRSEEAFSSALVRDIGKIVVAMSAPDRFAEVVSTVRNGGHAFHDVERRVLGFSHGEAGAYLLGLWGLPAVFLEVAAWHHEPGAIGIGGNSDVLAAVHVADSLIDTACTGELDLSTDRKLDRDYLARSGHIADLAAWRSLAAEEIHRTAGARSSPRH